MPFGSVFNSGFVPPPRLIPGGGGGSPTPPSIPRGSTGGAIFGALWTQTYTVSRPVLEMNVMRNDTHVNESPRYTVAGESIAMVWVFEGATTCSTPVVAAYKDGTAVTSTLFPTNTPSASGNTVTFSAMTGMVGGDRYVVTLTVVVDGSTWVKKLVVVCAAAEDE